MPKYGHLLDRHETSYLQFLKVRNFLKHLNNDNQASSLFQEESMEEETVEGFEPEHEAGISLVERDFHFFKSTKQSHAQYINVHKTGKSRPKTIKTTQLFNRQHIENHENYEKFKRICKP